MQIRNVRMMIMVTIYLVPYVIDGEINFLKTVHPVAGQPRPVGMEHLTQQDL
jgi:hypothetical protein